MKKLDEKGGTILFILTLVLGNDYVFFFTCLFCTAVLEKLKLADIFVKSISICKGLIHDRS